MLIFQCHCGGQARACGGGHEHAPDSGVLRRENRLFAGRQGRRCGRFASPPLPPRARATRTDAALGWYCVVVLRGGADVYKLAHIYYKQRHFKRALQVPVCVHRAQAYRMRCPQLSVRDGGK